MKEVRVDSAPSPIGPYSQAIIQEGLIYCSGQLGLDPTTGTLAKGVTEQTYQALKNLDFVLRGAGSSLKGAIRVTVYLIDLSSFADFNTVYAEFFASPYPARTVVQVSGLPKGAAVEIDVIATR